MAESRYQPTNWINGHTTALNATNLNKIEKELNTLDTESVVNTAKIATLEDNVDDLQATTVTLQSDVNSHSESIKNADTDIKNLQAAVKQNSDEIQGKADSAVVSSLSEQLSTLEQKVDTEIGGGTATSIAWSNVTGKPTAYTPTSHASAATTYGVGTTTSYGHVKISNGDVSSITASEGVAAGMDHTHSNYATKTELNNTKVAVINDLNSTSTTAALSAAQGKALKASIDSITIDIGELGSGDMLRATYDTDGDGVIDNAKTLDTHPVTYFATASHNHDSIYAAKSHTHSDYVNQAAYSNIRVGDTTIAAGSTTDTITLVAGNNVTLSADTSSKTVTINSAYTNTDTKVTSAANHYIPSTDNASTLNVDASSTTSATWNSTSLVTGVNLQRDTKGHVTGLTVDAVKMPAAPATGVTSITQDSSDGHKLTVITNGTTATITIPDNNTTYTFNGAISTIKDSNLTASRALISNASGKVATSDVTLTELGYLDGVTSNIQTQLNTLKEMFSWKEF